MTIRINRTKCNGCPGRAEPRCAGVCPGDLLYRDAENKAAVRDQKDCWDCAACVKECARQAIEMFLPVQIGGRGSTLKARTVKGRIIWKLTKPDNSEEVIVVTK